MSNLDPVVQIGDWHYQVVYGQLWRADQPEGSEQLHRLEPRLHSLLNFFLLHPNTLLAKDTLIEHVWPADEGTDAAVMRAVGALRKVLGDDVRSPSYIATVSKKGYCWLAEIRPASNVNFAAPVEYRQPEIMVSETEFSHQNQNHSWRFIMLTAAVVLICCASLAFVLAKFTAAPLVKLPDTITPISALSGQENWPLLSEDKDYVIYQHQPLQQRLLNWSRQNLADLKVEHIPQTYLQLSQPLWIDRNSIVFSAAPVSGSCVFYQQTLLPDIAPAQSLPWQCKQVLPQGLARWQQQWLWADVMPGSAEIVLYSATTDSAGAVVNKISHNWRQLDAILVNEDDLYLLVQHGASNSGIYRLTLPDGKPELIKAFNYRVAQFSWWAKEQLLLSPQRRQLEILDLNDLTLQALGPLTLDLHQAVRTPGQVLATQFLDYTTDIFKLKQVPATTPEPSLIMAPWHVSNRSERLLAIEGENIAYVSERTGQAQVWLAQGKDSTQLTRLNDAEHIQQILWHQSKLLLLVNNSLYQLEPDTTELSLHPVQTAIPGRFTSCADKLYWTTLTDKGWQLQTFTDGSVQTLVADVVDVRCAPTMGLLLQFASSSQLSLWRDGKLTVLPVAIDWRLLEAERWFSDATGVYWLDSTQHLLQGYLWHSAEVTAVSWPEPGLPLAIYGAGNGVEYVVRQRPYDTDIVWLQNRR